MKDQAVWQSDGLAAEWWPGLQLGGGFITSAHKPQGICRLQPDAAALLLQTICKIAKWRPPCSPDCGLAHGRYGRLFAGWPT